MRETMTDVVVRRVLIAYLRRRYARRVKIILGISLASLIAALYIAMRSSGSATSSGGFEPPSHG
jgi:hypothetical protein